MKKLIIGFFCFLFSVNEVFPQCAIITNISAPPNVDICTSFNLVISTSAGGSFQVGGVNNLTCTTGTCPIQSNGNYLITVPGAGTYTFAAEFCLVPPVNSNSRSIVIYDPSGAPQCQAVAVVINNYPYLISPQIPSTWSNIDENTSGIGVLKAKVNDHFERDFYYQNTGGLIDNNCIIRFSDQFCLDNSIAVTGYDIYLNNLNGSPVITNIAPTAIMNGQYIAGYSFSIDLTGYNVSSGTNTIIIIKEKGILLSCPNCSNGLPLSSNIILDYGCSVTTLCNQVNPSLTANIERSDKQPILEVSRCLPGNICGVANTANAYYLPEENICSEEFTDWTYTIKNIGSAPALNVVLAMSSDSKSYTYLFDDPDIGDDFYFKNLTNPGTICNAGSVSEVCLDTDQGSINFTSYLVDNVANQSICLVDQIREGNNPFYRIKFLPITILPNEEYEFHFRTFTCCASDAEPNVTKIYNSWHLSVTGENDCENIVSPSVHDHTDLLWTCHNPWPASVNEGISYEWPFSSNSQDLNITQSFDTPTSYMQGSGTTTSGTTNCFETENFVIDNLSFSDWVFYPHTCNVPITAFPQMRVVITLQPGLCITDNNLPNIHLANGGTPWIPSGVTQTTDINNPAIVCPSFTSAYRTITLTYDFANFPLLGGGTQRTLAAFQAFWTGSTFSFDLTAYCSGNVTNADFQIDFFYNAACGNDCWIPMTRQGNNIVILCPGCITPGMIVDHADLFRNNMGLEDKDNDRIPDNTTTIDPNNYMSGGIALPIKRSRVIVGDEMISRISAHLQEGDPTHTPDPGISLFQLQSPPHNLVFDHLYLEQNIELSKISGTGDFMNFNLEKISITILPSVACSGTNPQLGPTLFQASALPAGFVQHVDDEFFFDFSKNMIDQLFPNNCYTINENDNFYFEIYYRVCGNHITGGQRVEAKMNAAMYISDQAKTDHSYYTSSGIVKSFGEYWSDPAQYNYGVAAPVWPVNHGHLYICQPSGSNLYLYPVKFTTNYQWYDKDYDISFALSENAFPGNYLKCKKGLSMWGEAKIGGQLTHLENVFPYEFKSMPSQVNQFEFYIPPSYQIENVFSNTVVRRFIPPSIIPQLLYYSRKENFTQTNHQVWPFSALDHAAISLAQPPYNSLPTLTSFVNNGMSQQWTDNGLLYGDEYVKQKLFVEFAPVCNSSSQVTSTPTCDNGVLCDGNASSNPCPNVSFENTSTAPSICGDVPVVSPTTVSNNNNNAHCFTSPNPDIILSYAYNLPSGNNTTLATSSTVSWIVNLKNNAGGSDPSTAERMFLSLPSLSPVTITSVEICSDQNCSGVNPLALVNGSYVNVWLLGNLLPGDSKYYRINAAYSPCVAPDNIVNVPIEYGYYCSQSNQDINNNCGIKQSSLIAQEARTKLDKYTTSISNPLDYGTCRTFDFEAGVTSIDLGQAQGFNINLTLPSHLLLASPTFWQVSSNIAALNFDNTTVGVPALLPGPPGVYTMNLSSLTLPNAGLSNGDWIKFKFKVYVECGYQGQMPSVSFDATSFCLNPLQSLFPFSIWQNTLSNNCTTACSNPCAGKPTGTPAINVLTPPSGNICDNQIKILQSDQLPCATEYHWYSDDPVQFAQMNSTSFTSANSSSPFITATDQVQIKCGPYAQLGGLSGYRIYLFQSNTGNTKHSTTVSKWIRGVVSSPVLSGPTIVCPGCVATYSCQSIVGAEVYEWNVPAGCLINGTAVTTVLTTVPNISVTFPTTIFNNTNNTGVISVKAGFLCGYRTAPVGNNSPSQLTVGFNYPRPNWIDGVTSGLCNTLVDISYSCDPVNNFSTCPSNSVYYHWTVPQGAVITNGQGTDKIDVDFGSTPNTGSSVCVTAHACDLTDMHDPNNYNLVNPGIRRCITVKGAPTASGISSLGSCTYSVTSTSAKPISYNWVIIPTSAGTITSGQGTNQVTINWNGNVSATLNVTVFNGCGGTTKVLTGSFSNCVLRVSNTIQAAQSEDIISIYPNPNDGNFVLTGCNQDCSLDIFNSLGASISFTQKTINENERIVMLSQITPGLYVIKIQSNDAVFLRKVEILR